MTPPLTTSLGTHLGLFQVAQVQEEVEITAMDIKAVYRRAKRMDHAAWVPSREQRSGDIWGGGEAKGWKSITGHEEQRNEPREPSRGSTEDAGPGRESAGRAGRAQAPGRRRLTREELREDLLYQGHHEAPKLTLGLGQLPQPHQLHHLCPHVGGLG